MSNGRNMYESITIKGSKMKLTAMQVSSVVLMRELYGIPWNEIAFILKGLTSEKISGSNLHDQVTKVHPELKGKK